jgi:hypothetical protein
MWIFWLAVLLVYGWLNGFAEIPTLHWWLLLPMFAQNCLDVKVQATLKSLEQFQDTIKDVLKLTFKGK